MCEAKGRGLVRSIGGRIGDLLSFLFFMSLHHPPPLSLNSSFPFNVRARSLAVMSGVAFLLPSTPTLFSKLLVKTPGSARNNKAFKGR